MQATSKSSKKGKIRDKILIKIKITVAKNTQTSSNGQKNAGFKGLFLFTVKIYSEKVHGNWKLNLSFFK